MSTNVDVCAPSVQTYFVMSDWGAVHSTVSAAMSGLDQESGEQLDTQNFFGAPLAQAVADGEVPEARLNDMARRILTSIFAHGLADKTDGSDSVDFASSDRTALAIEREGVVLLRKSGPVAALRRPAQPPRDRSSRRSWRALRRRLFASHSARRRRRERTDRREPRHDLRPRIAARGDPSPVSARPGGLRRRIDPRASRRGRGQGGCGHPVRRPMDDRKRGRPEYQAAGRTGPAHRGCHACQPAHHGRARNGRPGGDALARRTAAVLEAWYPGQMGAEAIAEIFSGAANPSGRLPVTFPVGEDQLPHPKI